MLRWLACLGILASCGRLSFDARGGDAGADAQIVVDGAPDRPGIVFLSAATPQGNFGGLAAADATCASEAAAAGLPGTFIAFLSEGTTKGRDRLAGSRGWTLVDGSPVGDTIDSMIDNDRVLNAIDMLPNGTHVINGSTWTGSDLNGLSDVARQCNGWTDATAAFTGQGQSIRSAIIAGSNAPACTSNRHFLCFEIGHAHDLTITPVAGRYTFMTTAVRSTAIDVPMGDALCNSEATAAGLPGTYLVALDTSATSIASRFTIDARPWVRVDGTPVSAASEMFTATTPLLSFINQHADGTYQSLTFWTGVATTPDAIGTTTCADWTSVSSGSNAQAGQSHQTLRAPFWSGTTGNCGTNAFAMLCMQQ